MNNLNQFVSQIPADCKNLITILNSEGWVVRIVGGIVRDFLVDGKIGDDWDLEIMPIAEQLNLKVLSTTLSNHYPHIKHAAYQVMSLTFDNGISIELTPARREVFLDQTGHHNFSAEWLVNQSASLCFARRDFTINAMAVSFYPGKDVIFEDPFNGLKDLQQKQLVNCSPEFVKDPVRALRAYRFANKLKFSIAPHLINDLSKMNLSEVSQHYWLNELAKASDWGLMLKSILSAYGHQADQRWYQTLSVIDKSYRSLPNIPFNGHFLIVVASSFEHEMLAHHWQLPIKKIERWHQFIHFLENSSQWAEAIEKEIKTRSFEEIEDSSVFTSSFQFFKLWQDLSLDLEDWGIDLVDLTKCFNPGLDLMAFRRFLRFFLIITGQPDLESIPPEKRAKYLFYRRLKLNFAR